MQAFLLNHALGLVLPMLTGPLVYFLSKFVLNAHDKIDALPSAAKKAVVFALALGIALLYQKLGAPLPDACAGVPNGDVSGDCWSALTAPTIINSIVAWCIATFMHALEKYQGAKK